VHYDLGAIPPDATVERVIFVRNESSRRSSVKDVSSDCGCLITHISPEPMDPGKKWELRIRYRVPKTPGWVAHRVILSLREEGAEPILVQIAGSVRTWAEPYPEEVAFGEVLPGRVAEKKWTVFTPKVDQRLAGQPRATGVPWVTVVSSSAEETTTDGEGSRGMLHRFRLRFAPPPEAQPASHNGEIVLTAAGSGSSLRVPCSARVLPKLSAVPEELFFGFVRRGVPSTGQVRLRLYEEHRIKQPVEWVVRHDLGPEFTARVTTGALGEWFLRTQVVIAATTPVGVRTGVVTVTVPGVGALELPVKAWVEGEGTSGTSNQ
jgi:hypothetical protein